MSESEAVWAVCAAVFTIGFFVMWVLNKRLIKLLGETTDEYVEVCNEYADCASELLDTTTLYGAALLVAVNASTLLQYSERSTESFYGNTSVPTVQEQALARVFEVERNQAITDTRRALSALSALTQDIQERDDD